MSARGILSSPLPKCCSAGYLSCLSKSLRGQGPEWPTSSPHVVFPNEFPDINRSITLKCYSIHRNFLFSAAPLHPPNDKHDRLPRHQPDLAVAFPTTSLTRVRGLLGREFGFAPAHTSLADLVSLNRCRSDR